MDMANFLINNLDYLKNTFKIFKNLQELENKFEELADFGRMINNTVLSHLIRLKEESLVLIIFQYDCTLHEQSLYYIIKNEMRQILK